MLELESSSSVWWRPGCSDRVPRGRRALRWGVEGSALEPKTGETVMLKMVKTTLLAGVLLAGVSTGASAQIKIGVIQPLTGAAAASGNFVTNGAKIAADEINAKGGLLGQKIELI